MKQVLGAAGRKAGLLLPCPEDQSGRSLSVGNRPAGRGRLRDSRHDLRLPIPGRVCRLQCGAVGHLLGKVTGSL